MSFFTLLVSKSRKICTCSSIVNKEQYNIQYRIVAYSPNFVFLCISFSVAYLGFHKGGDQMFAGHYIVLTQRGGKLCFPNFFYGEKHKIFAKGGHGPIPP